jgi:hypothetical protein
MRFHNATQVGIRRAIRGVLDLSRSEVDDRVRTVILDSVMFDSFDGIEQNLKGFLSTREIDDDVFWRLAPLVMKGQMLVEEGFE